MMKLIVCLLATVALTQAHLKPAHLEPRLPFVRPIPSHRPLPRITGGEEVQPPHSLPYQVGLVIEGSTFCGGSLLSPTTVVTAAHCILLWNYIEIILGAHKIQENEDSQVRVVASQTVVHPDWNPLTLVNDIAILRINESLELNDNIQVIPLPSRANANKNYVGDVATASGWGLDSDTSIIISPVLRKVDVPVIANNVCNMSYFGILKDTHICTNGANGKSTCNGDSGGPLRASTGELIGITSFGISFGCEIGYPPVFTRVPKYLDWIEQNSDVVVN